MSAANPFLRSASKMAASASSRLLIRQTVSQYHSSSFRSAPSGVLQSSSSLAPLISGPSTTHSPLSNAGGVTTLSRRHGHTVRIILTKDLPDGRGYNGDVMTVRAGYARNFLVPKKMALYATPDNFVRLGMVDPEAETVEEKRARMAAEAAAEDDEEAAADLKAADLLKYYLRNKVLKIYRNVDQSTGAVFPGLVNAQDVREKLSKQLKIDLEDHEIVQLRAKPVILGHDELTEDDVAQIMEEIGANEEGTAEEKGGKEEEKCKVEIRALGEYVAKITLRGNHAIPLKFAVLKR